MKFKFSFLAILCVLQVLSVYAQSSRDITTRDSTSVNNTFQNIMSRDTGNQGSAMDLRRITIFSSGLAYFEHSGNLQSPAEITLPFDAGAVNDALKSLVINDPASSSPLVSYAAENSLDQTLRSLRIDLSGNPGLAQILNNLKGAELELSAPNTIRGRIIGVEYRLAPMNQDHSSQRWGEEAWLSLSTAQGIRAVAIANIASFRFIDERINADLNRALDLIMTSRDTNTRDLVVSLNGNGNRRVSLSYVIPVPVWKVSYRLDLSPIGQAGKEPFLQGWAIVDNDSDNDWKNVELSLVTGRPVSFIQNLYPPYRVSRPILPLSIAGIAESRTHDSGYAEDIRARSNVTARMMPEAMADESYGVFYESAPRAAAAPSVAGGVVETASGRAAGDQFEFTLKNPVSLERRQSAMLPLVEGSVKAEKMLVFSGRLAQGSTSINPGISVELTNTSGMKLPAGPITVYDGGTYAGDALIEFFPEGEKRLISYGEDLSVTGSASFENPRHITAVNISGGVMTISRRQSNERTYTIRNASAEAKKLIIEHPITPGAELVEPLSSDDRTANLYRFSRNLAARQTLTFKVREEIPLSERITLATLRADTFLSYSTSQEIPANVRAALTRAISLKKAADDAREAQVLLENQQTRLFSEQDRIRRNLEATGNQSPQGQEYLRRLSALDSDIDKLNVQIDAAAKETERARREYDNYLATVNI